MNPVISLYTELLWRPLFNGLIGLYVVLPWQDLGLAIVVLTVIIRLLLLPLFWKIQRAQRDLAALQPEIKKIQADSKGNREVQGRALMELYAKHKVNPFSGCIIMVVQLPILIALFQVFQQGFDAAQLKYLYSFVQNPGNLNPLSFWILDLSKGSIYLGVVAAITQYFQTKLITPAIGPSPGPGDFSRMMQWQALYVFPALILVWSYTLPSALTLYWTVLNVLGILQEVITQRIAGRNLQGRNAPL